MSEPQDRADAATGGAPRGGRHFGFLLLPGFSHYSFAAALEPLRSANILMRRDHFSWSLIGAGAAQVRASNGLSLGVDHDIAEARDAIQARGFDHVIVLAASDVTASDTGRIEAFLRFQHRQGGHIGAVSSGVVVLARTGLLDDRDCAAHWEDTPRLRTAFPRINVTGNIFVLDRRLATCAGGAAGAHMMLAILEREVGPGLARDVASRMVIDRIRDGEDELNMQPHIRYGTWNRKILKAIAIMNQNISEPLSMREIAASAHASVRQLERLFRKELNLSPDRFYRHIRLSRARQLLRYSEHSLGEIAMICGFGTTRAMKDNYEAFFGYAPRDERQAPAEPASGGAPGDPGTVLHHVNAQY
ncbi:MAG: GlxA family transcriptional regulator [Pseudomonadota bacterium]|uniref:GlxA family transcriptional regulator n=1 Tax=Roseovarius TaxID=74030 RepID=UPI0022A816CE|nr:GlxA family transcriptional regulator [Roseovarius sp. EGI FJ00037]MCZ0813464.1 GlxA family transcriptional regulator [Roseovarius sp. EGI FJ00037]